MHHRLLPAVLGCALPLVAQHQVGWRDMPLANRTASGSAILQARVAYPAANGGPDAPILQRPGGWPVVVFLHGNGTTGKMYENVRDPLVLAGTVVVLSDTALSSASLQREDGTALYPTLTAENADPASPLHGALDMRRCALQGYSMGAGNTIRILAANPGYCAGFVHAPTSGVSLAAGVKVPFCSVHGLGDTTSPPSNSSTLFNLSTAFTGTKTIYLLGSEADHFNVISDALQRPHDAAVWARVRSLFLGFFDCYLRGDPSGLDRVVGAEPRSEPRLAALSHAVHTPVQWLVGSGSLGTNLHVGYDGEPGLSCTAIAAQPADLATPFGTLRLDPASLVVVATPAISATRLVSLDLALPVAPALVGQKVWLQAAAWTVSLGLRLSNGTEVTLRQ